MLNRPGRFLSFLLALCLILTAMPAGSIDSAMAEDTATATVYGITTADKVYVRKSPSTSASFWFRVDSGHICEVLDQTDSGGIHWYKVNCVHPDPDSTKTYVGYIHGNFFRLLTAEETAEYLEGKAIAEKYANATPTPETDTTKTNKETSTTGTVTNGGTNFREGPSMKAHSIMKLDRGTVVVVTSIPEAIDENHWYGVNYAGYTGYIRSDFLKVEGAATAEPTTSGDATATPTPTPTATATDYSKFNAVQLILTSCHLRESPGGTWDRKNDLEGKGSILPLAGVPVAYGQYIWYPVTFNNKTYYVRGDCVQLIYDSSIGTPTPTPTPTPEGWTPTPTPAVTATPTPTPTPTAKPTSTSSIYLGYVMTTKGGVNLRATIAGTVIRQLPKYLTLPYLLKPVKKNGYTWYYVEYNNLRGYLRSDVVKVVSVTPTATPTPDPESSGYVITTADSVNLRVKAGYKNKTLGRVDKGVTMPYYGEPTTVNNVQWYRVKHPTLGYGYIHGGFVSVVSTNPTATPTATGSGTETPTPTPTGGSATATPTATATATPDSSTKKEASYTTLKKGSTGTAVKRLVTALKNLGYYTGSITSSYTSAVVAAVKAFQAAVGISVDGVAGAATQHALYGTVPEGTNTSLTMDIYPAEKIDWWSGGINELWAKGTNYKIYDVKTGIVWWAHRWSGGYHVDAEPLTAGDTARLCKCYGVTTAQEIANQNLYQRRPLLVTIGTRTFACSLYGVPHNYPDGDTISTNDFKGQLCIHFTNSWTHGSKKVDSLHAEAIQYAYDHAPNGNK